MSKRGEGLSPKERIRLQRDFDRIFKKGKKIWVDKYLLIIFAPNDLTYRRVGIIVSSKVGTAVERNRVKRVLRAVFRRNKDLFPENSDIVLIANPSIKNLDYWKILQLLQEKLKSNG